MSTPYRRPYIAVWLIPVLLLLALSGCAPVPVSPDAGGAPLALYLAPAEGIPAGVQRAVELMSASGVASVTADLAQADVIVIGGGSIPAAPLVDRIVDGDAGLLLFLDTATTSAQLAALGIAGEVSPADDAVSLNPATATEHPILDDIVWSSAPQVRERTVLNRGATAPLLTGYETGEPLLAAVQVGEGAGFIFTPHLDGANSQIQEWPYFNYMIYNLAARAAGRTPLSFGQYPASPVPHTRERVVLVAFCAGMMLLALTAFVLIRRYSLAHPEALDAIVGSRERFEAREAGTAWEEVGFHRPLAGFLFAMMMGLLLFIPLIIYQNMILPAYVLPSAQAFGLIGRVAQAFGLAWTLFDVGTSVAFIKFYAQYRVKNPRRAIKFGQVYVWWQALSGALQVALVVMLAGTLVPRTAYAVYTWIIVIHALIQIPGFYGVMRNAMYAQQRLDYAQVLDNFYMLVWPMLAQPVLVLLMLAWSRRAPTVGVALGGAMGLALAAYFVEVCHFVLGLRLYRRLGYNSRILFMAHFDRSVIKEAFGFGVLDMSGSLILAAGSAIEIVVTQTRLVNYAEIWGNWMMANNFILAFDVLRNLVDGVMPAISESISHGWRKLSRYYVAMTYKWDGLVAGYVAAVLLAVADRFILGSSGPEFTRAAIYVLPLIAFGSVLHLNIIGDAVALASNRPALKTGMIVAEQVIRLALALVLLARFQVTGLIIAYLAGTLIRGIAVYFINSRACFPLRYYPWPSLVAPLLAGAVHYGVLRFVTGLIWQNEPLTSVLIFLIGILFSYPLYTFLYGLAGGWDDATLDELAHAVRMQPALGFMARAFYGATALGARFSPLHNRFPITIREEAIVEAQALTAERVSLATMRDVARLDLAPPGAPVSEVPAISGV